LLTADLADYTIVGITWLSDLLQSELKIKMLEVEGGTCPIAGDATEYIGRACTMQPQYKKSTDVTYPTNELLLPDTEPIIPSLVISKPFFFSCRDCRLHGSAVDACHVRYCRRCSKVRMRRRNTRRLRMLLRHRNCSLPNSGFASRR